MDGDDVQRGLRHFAFFDVDVVSPEHVQPRGIPLHGEIRNFSQHPPHRLLLATRLRKADEQVGDLTGCLQLFTDLLSFVYRSVVFCLQICCLFTCVFTSCCVFTDLLCVYRSVPCLHKCCHVFTDML